MSEFFSIMALPLLACLIFAGIHAYLGFHVIERQVIFVDLALAQIAAVGASVALVLGHELDSGAAYGLSLAFTLAGAVIFSLTRFRQQKIPQEAIIGITYAVSAALLILVLSRSGQGDEQIRQTLVGNVLLVSWPEVVKISVIYALVGAAHFVFRRQFFLISQNPQRAFAQGLNVRLWDFLFYGLFGIVVTSSVKIAGVLLVFAFLIVPPVCAMLWTDRIEKRIALGWGIGFLVSILGLALSYWADFPTGACVVVTFGVVLAVCGALKSQLRTRVRNWDKSF